MPQFSDAFHRWRRELKPAFATLSVRTFGRLPLLWNRQIGLVLGHLVWWSRGNTVKISLDNINKAFPELTPEQRFAMTKISIIETAKAAFESFSVWMHDPNQLQTLVASVENQNLLDSKINDKNGLIVLVPHLGNWEFIGSFLPRLMDTTFIYQPSGIEAMDKLVRDGRAKKGVKLAPANRQGVAQVMRALKDGKGVGILPDQVPDRNSGGGIANFFGNRAWTMTLVHKLIQRTQCQVLMAYVERVPKGFTVHFVEADEAIYNDDETESLNGLNRSIENCVRKIPEQYQWEYKRYKRT